MKTISKEYIILFNEITDASTTLTKLTNELSKVTRQLMHAQQRTEEMFILDEDNTESVTD